MPIAENVEQAPVLRQLVSRLVGQAALLVGRISGDALAAEGAHHYHFATLATLDAFGPLSQAELCRRTGIDRSDMSWVMNNLEADGSVERRVNHKSRRENLISLTSQGNIRFAVLLEKVEQAQDTALAGLAPMEKDELVRLLRKLLASSAR